MTARTSEKLEYSLVEGLSAVVEISRVGQVDPQYGDGVEVEGRVYLPTSGNGAEDLHPDIVFGERVFVCGFPTDRWWGYSTRDHMSRYRKQAFQATTWREAFAQARDWGEAEIEKLLVALSLRRQALIDAEN